MKSLLRNILALALLVVLAYQFQPDIKQSLHILQTKYLPCRSPITYSIGSFDERFQISKEEFLLALNEAEEIWEGPLRESLGKELFQYKEDGYMKINLIYDDRQDATVTLQEMGVSIDSSKSSFDVMKDKYEALRAEYVNKKNDFDFRSSAFRVKQTKYQNDVSYWNSKGGAPDAEYKRLERERDALSEEANALNKMQSDINKTVAELNAMAEKLNATAKDLNLDVKKFNEIGKAYSGEFEEGTYESDREGTRINVYQYEDKTKLVRLLAHEFGHAVGLGHLEDSKAIMYRLNNGVNAFLTEADLVAIKEQCKI